MAGVRFQSARLGYGCHDRTFELPGAERPIVVAGGNGSGKSTLLEGLVRTLYGFNRRASVEGYTHEQREPWSAEAYEGRVEIVGPGGERTAIRRDFEAATVEVELLDTEAQPWTGDGNPAATNLQAKAFRTRLRTLFGLDNFEDYGRTAYVQQGELSQTELSKQLLRAAAGGTVDVDAARASIRKLHRELTRAPIADAERGGNNARRREELEQRLAELREELRHAESAERRRAPLIEERGAVENDIDRLRAEIDDLEAAQQPLMERQELALKLSPLRDRIRRLEGLSQELALAVGTLRNAVSARTVERGSHAPLPDDFPEHAAALTELWANHRRQSERRDKYQIERDRIPRPAIGWWISAAIGALAGLALLVTGQATLGAVAAGLGVLLAGFAGWRLRSATAQRQALDVAVRAATEELRDIQRSIDGRCASLPNGDELTSDALPLFRERFERQRRTRAIADRAREELDAVLARARSMGAEEVEVPDEGPESSAEVWLGVLGDRVSQGRNELVRCQRRLEESEERPVRLPDGVEADLASVRDALSSRRRSERERLDELRDVERRLVEDGTPTRSPVALREAVEGIENEIAVLDETIDAYRLAWSLVGQAHTRFRDEDEQRLTTAISRHLSELSEGRLGPLELDDGLDDATVRAFGRSVPLDYRPLSFGQYHIALLAVRLGAADFLARSGIRVPLIIDEPFANLDDENAALVWQQLQRIATERQVIVATQESALLQRLEITPDIRL